MKTLYLTDFNPNGTNDLMVVDEFGHIIDTVQEATSGFQRENYDVAYDYFEIKPLIYLANENCGGAWEVTVSDILEHMYVSALDPRGQNLEEALASAEVV